MPLIPRTSEQAQIQASAPVQIASTGDARIQGDAIARFGDAVTKFGEQQLENDRTLRRAEFKDELQNTVKVASESARQNALPDGSNYAEEFYKVAEPATTKLINQYGSMDPKLRAEFESYTARVKGDVDTTLMIQKAQMQEQNNFNRADALGKSSSNRLREDVPLTDKSVANYVRAEISAHTNMVDGLSLTPENNMKMKKAYLSEASQSFIDGLGNKQRYGEALKYLTATQKTPDVSTEFKPAEAQALGFISSAEAQALSSKGEMFKVPLETTRKGEKVDPSITHLLSGLTEPQRASLIDKMQAKIKEQAQVRASDLSQSLSGYEKFRGSGGQVSNAERSQLVSQINALPGATPIAKRRLIDRVMTADAVGDQMAVAATTPRSQLSNLVANVSKAIESNAAQAAARDPQLADNGRDFAIIENRSEAMARFQTSMANMIKAQNDDPAGYLLKNDPEIALAARGVKDGTGVEQFTTTLLSKQRYLGMPQAVLTKQQALGVAAQLTSNPDATATNDYMTQLQTQYGKHFPELMRQVTEKSKSLAPLQAVAYANPQARLDAIDAIKAQPQLKIEFAKPENRDLKKDIDNNVQSVMANFRTAVVSGTNDTSRLGVVQGMEDLISLQAQRDVQRGASPKEAVKKAYGDIVDASYQIVTGGRSTVLLPREIAPDDRIVKSFLTVYNNDTNDLIDDFQVAGKNASARNMRWVTNEAQTGMRLVEQMPDGSLQAVYNTSKEVIQVSYDDINMHPPKKVLERTKNPLQRLFGG